MKDNIFDAKLSAARPDGHKANALFTDKVMATIQSSEILSSQIRKTSVNKKETLFMKLHHLPKFAIVAIAAGALLLLSGTAYATYQLLWPKPEASVSEPTTSSSGRKEVSLLFSSCGEAQSPNRYELKRDATITEDKIEGVVKAQCELQAINEWALSTYGGKLSDGTYKLDSKSHAARFPMVSMATHIATIDSSSITFAGLDTYNIADTTMDVSKEVRYIANGTDVSAADFKPGDSVVYVARQGTIQTPKEDCTTDACREFGEYRGTQTLVAVVKLDRPFEDYDQSAWQSLTELSACEGNPDDLCLGGYSGSIDLYNNADYQGSKEKMMTKEIQGVITKMDGTTYTIKSTSGSLYTVTTPTDVITNFNKNQSAGYNNQKIKVGNTLSIRYGEKESEHTKTITAGTVFTLTVKLEMTRKGDAPTLY
jgi:hypothetical protein